MDRVILANFQIQTTIKSPTKNLLSGDTRIDGDSESVGSSIMEWKFIQIDATIQETDYSDKSLKQIVS